ncbi:ferritin [candidate division KSB1 bacterium]|nr:ferritin [candidate division KSB1 bacterium]RQW02554.1 MAG: ferritin [candidate division KSB1 bacterium]
MISQAMEKAINTQINKELYSAYYYAAMAAYLDNEGFEGMANFMKAQAHEETEHAQKFYDYINEQGGRVILGAIDQPPVDYDSPKQIFELALKHEKYVTSLIHELVTLALEEKDYATKAFLDWFVTEQVEEEATMESILNKFKIIGDSGHALYMLDAKLGERAPATAAEDDD